MIETEARNINAGFAALSTDVRKAGLMERRVGVYSLQAGLTLVALIGAWAALFIVGNTWAIMAVAVGLGVIFTQVVFFGHDAGHHQIFAGRRANRAVGLITGDLLTGLSFGWWVPKHGAHHAHPNQVDGDPDIGPGVIAFTAEVAAGRHGSGRLAARLQAWSFFPLLTLEGISLHIASIRSILGRRDRFAGWEACLITLHAAAYLGAIFWVLSPAKAVAFIAVQQGVFGFYLGCSFAPNHKGMPTIGVDARLSFVEQQILTARNVTGGPLMSFALGGLNYQIEHHLFPTMPRVNLAKSQPFVRAFCHEHGLAYCEDTIVGSHRASLTHLHSIGTGGADPALPEPPGLPSAQSLCEGAA